MTNPNPLFIALGGRAGHGKTTLSRALLAHLRARGISAHITSFAEVPKRMLHWMGLSAEQLYGSLKETPAPELAGRTPRYAMQTLATEWGRNMLYEEIWVDAWERSLTSLESPQVIIVDDLRHVPEMLRLRELHAVMIEVYRPSKMPNTFWGWAKHHWRRLFIHSSEQLDFSNHGITRLVVEEGQTDVTLQKLLALIKQLQ